MDHQMISDAHGIAMRQDRFHTNEHCFLGSAYYSHRNGIGGFPPVQDQSPQQLQQQMNSVNSDEVLGDEVEGYVAMEDLRQDDAMENEIQLYSEIFELIQQALNNSTEGVVSEDGAYGTGVPQVQDDLDLNVPQNFWNYSPQLIQQELSNSLDEVGSSEEGISDNDDWEDLLMYLTGYSVPMDIEEYEFLWGANGGLQEDAILMNLKTRRYVKEDDQSEMCVVCQLEYEDNERLGTLGCGHDYHVDCIKTWLIQKNVCSLCKQTAIVS